MLANVSLASDAIKSLRTFFDRSPSGADFSMIVLANDLTPELDRKRMSLPVLWIVSLAVQPIPPTASLSDIVDGVVAFA